MKHVYDRNLYVKPFYQTNTIYYETALFIGSDDIVSFIFPIKKIIAVLNYGLNKEYVFGKDYIVTEDGKIKRTPNSEIPFFEPEDYYLEEPNDKNIRLGVSNIEIIKKYPFAKYFVFADQDFFTSKQISVIYEHDGSWEGTKPIFQGEKVKRFINKIKNGENPTILFYGDSITYGYSSSGTDMGGNVAPYAESYPQMVYRFLETKYNSKINYVNTACNGQNTYWGLEHVEENVNDYNPDLVVLAFGMNNGNDPKENYKKWLEEIISKIEQHNPNVEFIVVSPTVPNVDCDWFGQQYTYIDVIKELNRDNVAVVDMTNIHLDLLKSGKKFADMTANNINHPNDFLARVYAQFILSTIIKY